jgi:hypothetical protein
VPKMTNNELAAAFIADLKSEGVSIFRGRDDTLSRRNWLYITPEGQSSKNVSPDELCERVRDWLIGQRMPKSQRSVKRIAETVSYLAEQR